MYIAGESGAQHFWIDADPNRQFRRHDFASCPDADPSRWLADTRLLQIRHPRIRIQAAKLTQLCRDDRSRAIACFDFVQQFPFAFGSAAESLPADRVLAEKKGDSFSKSTLFVALLRSVGIPARMRFIALGGDLLWGIADTAGLPVERAITEVWLDSQWLCVDAYVADFQFSLAARSRLLREGRRYGFGLHARGRVSWKGTGDGIAVCDPADALSDSLVDLGAFDDPARFREVIRHSCRGAPLPGMRVAATLAANWKVNRLRNSLGPAARTYARRV